MGLLRPGRRRRDAGREEPRRGRLPA
jgi:hypothetical protein